MTTNTQIILASTPTGKLDESHFQIREGVVPAIDDQQILVRNILLSVDAANRAWILGPTYKPQIQPGEVMHGYSIGEVVDSKAPGVSVGELVMGELGWQEFAAVPAKWIKKVGDHRPLTHQHSLLGVAGMTAYHGALTVAGVSAGETLLVSAAAGSVGTFVGQIGKIRGARVVGIAGGPEKCEWLQKDLGFDACIDYKNENVREALGKNCPEGVDVYFDNVGGEILEAALRAMNLNGRIACCGAVSQYDGGQTSGPVGVPGTLVVKRITMRGFIVADYPEHDAQAMHDLASWASSGSMKVVEDVIDGLDNAPRGLIGLLAGENRGKRMIRIAPDPH